MRIQFKYENLVRATGKGVLASFVALLLAVIAQFSGVFTTEDQVVQDWQASFISKPPSGQTTIVAIDQESIQQLGGFPIGREHLAKVLDTLNEAGVNRIFVDLSFASEHGEQHDSALESALARLGPDRVALAMKLVENEGVPNAKGQTKLLRPLQRFADRSNLVMADIVFGSDGLVRSLGPRFHKEMEIPCNAAVWLTHGPDSSVQKTGVDFRIDVNDIPEISMMDVLNRSEASLASVHGKNVILGPVASHLINTVRVPRYGYIHRTRFVALAADTIALASEPVQLSTGVMILSLVALLMALGFLLPRVTLIVGGLVSLLLTTGIFIVGVMVQTTTNISFSPFMPLVAIWLTYVGTLIATHSAFKQTRTAIKSFVGKFDHGLAKLFHSNVDSIITFSPDGQILTINETAEKLFNLKADEVVGKSLATILPGSADALLKAAAGHQPGRLEATVEDNSGMNRHVDLAFNSVPMESGWVGFASIRDISEFRAREEDLKRQATHDAMTGLPNRMAFEKNLAATLQFASETNRSFAVFLLDLNKFKQVNDTLGHHVGDALLIEVAKRLKNSIRNCDFVCRLGGDEFAVVVAPPANHECAESIAKEIVQSISDIQELEGNKIETGSSIGVAFYPQHATNADELVRVADEAMYQAKRGKCGFKIASSDAVAV